MRNCERRKTNDTKTEKRPPDLKPKKRPERKDSKRATQKSKTGVEK